MRITDRLKIAVYMFGRIGMWSIAGLVNGLLLGGLLSFGHLFSMYAVIIIEAFAVCLYLAGEEGEEDQ